MSKKETYTKLHKLLSNDHGFEATIKVDDILKLLANFMDGAQFEEFYEFVKEEYE